MKTYVDVIKEVKEYYDADVSRRAVVDDACDYYTPDGRMCAVGICLSEPEKFSNSEIDETKAEDLFDEYGFDILKDEYKHLTNEYFWQSLQEFHDGGSNWDLNGLTPDGQFMYENLIEMWKDV